MILNIGLKQFHHLAIFRLQLCHGRGIHALPLEHQNEARAWPPWRRGKPLLVRYRLSLHLLQLWRAPQWGRRYNGGPAHDHWQSRWVQCFIQNLSHGSCKHGNLKFWGGEANTKCIIESMILEGGNLGWGGGQFHIPPPSVWNPVSVLDYLMGTYMYMQLFIYVHCTWSKKESLQKLKVVLFCFLMPSPPSMIHISVNVHKKGLPSFSSDLGFLYMYIFCIGQYLVTIKRGFLDSDFFHS